MTEPEEPREPEQRCGDCRHFTRCQWLIQAVADDKHCDWTPSRFVAAAPSEGSDG